MDFLNFGKTYGFQNIEGVEENHKYIEKIVTNYMEYALKVLYWLTLPGGERTLSNTFIFFDTKPKRDTRLVMERKQ